MQIANKDGTSTNDNAVNFMRNVNGENPIILLCIPFWKLSNLIPVDVIQLFINSIVQKIGKKGTENAEHEHGKCSRLCKY